MRLNTAIAKHGLREQLHRVFLDFTGRVAFISDGFVAHYRKLDNNLMSAGDVPINTDAALQAKIFKPMIDPKNRVAACVIDSELLMLAVQTLKRELRDNELVYERQVVMEIYSNGDGFTVTFAQPDRAAVVMSLTNDTKCDGWKPFLKSESAE